MLKRGITLTKSRRRAEEECSALLQDAKTTLSGLIRQLVAKLAFGAKWAWRNDHEAYQQLMAILGIVPVTATAVVSAIGIQFSPFTESKSGDNS